MTDNCDSLGFISKSLKHIEPNFWRVHCNSIPASRVFFDSDGCDLITASTTQTALEQLCDGLINPEIETAFPIVGTGQTDDPITLDSILTDNDTIVGDGVTTPISIGSITTDASLTGDGSSGSPLSVAEPANNFLLSFRYDDPNGTPADVVMTTYTTLGSLGYQGTLFESVINKAIGLLQVKGGNAVGQARIFDLTYNNPILITPYFSNRGALISKELIHFNGFGQLMSAYVSRNPDISATLTLIYASNNNLGAVTVAEGTGFTSPFTIVTDKVGTILYGQITYIDTVGSTPGTIDGTWFAVYYGPLSSDYYFFWYDVDDSGTSQPVDPIGAGGIPFEINTIVTGDDDLLIGTKTTDAINIATTTGPNAINVPTLAAILEIQLRRVNDTGGGTAEIYTVQIYS